VGGIGVGHHNIGGNIRAVFQDNTPRRAINHFNRLDGLIEPDIDALSCHQVADRFGDGCSSTHSEMHAISPLKIMDQTVNTGGVERVATNQKRLNGKRLTQLGVFQIPTNQLPDRVVAA